jgi:3-phosphoshikimate 1-carboxyvinyltransferase
VTEIEGLLEGDDVKRTAAAMAAFGAGVERLGEGAWRVEGRGGFSEPADDVDCGNAGTGVRLIMGRRPASTWRDLHRRRLPARAADEPGA